MLTLFHIGSPWDEVSFVVSHEIYSQLSQDKTMMSRWGLEGMRSFEHKNVARKEKLGTEHPPPGPPDMVTAEGGAQLS
jgi:hypothetical protein